MRLGELRGVTTAPTARLRRALAEHLATRRAGPFCRLAMAFGSHSGAPPGPPPVSDEFAQWLVGLVHWSLPLTLQQQVLVVSLLGLGLLFAFAVCCLVGLLCGTRRVCEDMFPWLLPNERHHNSSKSIEQARTWINLDDADVELVDRALNGSPTGLSTARSSGLWTDRRDGYGTARSYGPLSTRRSVGTPQTTARGASSHRNGSDGFSGPPSSRRPTSEQLRLSGEYTLRIPAPQFMPLASPQVVTGQGPCRPPHGGGAGSPEPQRERGGGYTPLGVDDLDLGQIESGGAAGAPVVKPQPQRGHRGANAVMPPGLDLGAVPTEEEAAPTDEEAAAPTPATPKRSAHQAARAALREKGGGPSTARTPPSSGFLRASDFKSRGGSGAATSRSSGALTSRSSPLPRRVGAGAQLSSRGCFNRTDNNWYGV